jgi:hypothetical protein
MATPSTSLLSSSTSTKESSWGDWSVLAATQEMLSIPPAYTSTESKGIRKRYWRARTQKHRQLRRINKEAKELKLHDEIDTWIQRAVREGRGGRIRRLERQYPHHSTWNTLFIEDRERTMKIYQRAHSLNHMSMLWFMEEHDHWLLPRLSLYHMMAENRKPKLMAGLPTSLTFRIDDQKVLIDWLLRKRTDTLTESIMVDHNGKRIDWSWMLARVLSDANQQHGYPSASILRAVLILGGYAHYDAVINSPLLHGPYQGATPLQMVCHIGWYQAAKLLISMGAKVNYVPPLAPSSRYVAAEYFHIMVSGNDRPPSTLFLLVTVLILYGVMVGSYFLQYP